MNDTTQLDASTSDNVVITDVWHNVRQFTRARIALGRTGVSLPTREVLDFSLAHAQARDAVHLPLDVGTLSSQLAALGFEPTQVQSAAADRGAYLRRPDWGRRLNPASKQLLASKTPQTEADMPALAIVVADGLSSLAAEHAAPLLQSLIHLMPEVASAPLVIATQARVALGDEIGYLLGARQVVVLIGERPGLSSPDSLGIYLTHGPKPGLTDANRNCISNVRPEGLNYAAAAHKLAYLMVGARQLGQTGVALKDDSTPNPSPALSPASTAPRLSP